jgi:hypothetical protein
MSLARVQSVSHAGAPILAWWSRGAGRTSRSPFSPRFRICSATPDFLPPRIDKVLDANHRLVFPEPREVERRQKEVIMAFTDALMVIGLAYELSERANGELWPFASHSTGCAS